MSREYKTGLEFLNEGVCADRAEEVRDMCLQLGEDTEIAVLDGAAALVLSDNRGVLH